MPVCIDISARPASGRCDSGLLLSTTLLANRLSYSRRRLSVAIGSAGGGDDGSLYARGSTTGAACGSANCARLCASSARRRSWYSRTRSAVGAMAGEAAGAGRAGASGRPTTNMISSMNAASPASSHVCTPRGNTPRGDGRRSVTAGAAAGTLAGCAATGGVSSISHRPCCVNVNRSLPSAR